MPMDPRHALLFSTLFGLQPGESMEVTNDHDPSGLSYRLAEEHPGRFAWTWLEQGPVDWRFRVDCIAGSRPPPSRPPECRACPVARRHAGPAVAGSAAAAAPERHWIEPV